ncbi:MAG: prepilin-type N-terminal cleavage/methylation domain-containing protein [Patescibacteria group bacterium]|jgi:type IV pilus assembly protein PilA|nr:prepilin-type N-terminal cleavage/methylation domain-containing protein [Patescibacteria group bacterium]
MKRFRGFTLIELLIVIAVIAILAAIIFVAVDPARRLAEARNAARWSSVNSILNAYLKYTVDYSGQEPVSLTPDTEYMIGTGASATNCESVGGGTGTTTSAVIDLSPLVDTYLSSIPYDDTAGGDASKTFYWIKKTMNGRITIGACGAEIAGGNTPTITVTR